MKLIFRAITKWCRLSSYIEWL